MTVTILKDQQKAIDANGEIYEIEGIEIIRGVTGVSVFYDKKSSYYKAVAASGTKSNSRVVETGKIMLL
jgi:hypothetical protein